MAFALGATESHYKYARAAIHNIREKFGSENRIIFYDLGGVMENLDQVRVTQGKPRVNRVP